MYRHWTTGIFNMPSNQGSPLLGLSWVPSSYEPDETRQQTACGGKHIQWGHRLVFHLPCTTNLNLKGLSAPHLVERVPLVNRYRMRKSSVQSGLLLLGRCGGATAFFFIIALPPSFRQVSPVQERSESEGPWSRYTHGWISFVAKVKRWAGVVGVCCFHLQAMETVFSFKRCGSTSWPKNLPRRRTLASIISLFILPSRFVS